jgi:putative intracellular protease/amidase/DNA-directed RNA polymerase subunit RPC12/RpoP
MKQMKRRATGKDLTRRNFIKGGAGAVLAVSYLQELGWDASARAQPDDGATANVYVCTPCGLSCDKLEFDKPGTCPACGMALIEKSAADSLPTVGILLFDRVEIIDFAGPWEVFGGAGYKVFTVAEKTDPVNAVFGQHVVADYTFENSPRADVLLVPGGGIGGAVNNLTLIKWVQDNAQKSDHVMSVCTGAFILAKAGLLDGLSATTVRHAIDDLATAGRNIKPVYDKRYVDNGKVITTAGLSSGIDGAFYLVSKMKGLGTAQETALGLEYKWDPEAKFARAAYADRYLPNFKGFDAETISVRGDAERWERKALVANPASVAEIVELTQKQVVATPHLTSPVVIVPRKKPNELQWKFTDDRGRKWLGSETVEPSAERKGKFIVTVRLNRA